MGIETSIELMTDLAKTAIIGTATVGISGRMSYKLYDVDRSNYINYMATGFGLTSAGLLSEFDTVRKKPLIFRSGNGRLRMAMFIMQCSGLGVMIGPIPKLMGCS